MSTKQIAMSKEDAEFLYEVYARALSVLTEAETVLWTLPKGAARTDYIHAHAGVIADVLSKLRAPLVLQYPELDTDVPVGPSDLLMEPDEQEAVRRLTTEQVERIDVALLADCASSWRKVARVVGTVMMQLSQEFPEIPSGYYAQRIVTLVEQGLIVSEGNLEYMRYSEIRLSGCC